MKSVLLALVKYGGLAMSAILTAWLFTDLFWNKTPLGGALIVFSLVLFEGGAMLWLSLVNSGKGAQYLIAWGCALWCVFASIASSICQIVLATKIYDVGGFDMPLFTLILIAGSLTANVGGVVMFEFADPDVLSRQMDSIRSAMANMASWDKVLAFWKQVDQEAEQILKRRLPQYAERVANERAEDVIRLALNSSPGGQNTPTMLNRPPSTPRPTFTTPPLVRPQPTTTFAREDDDDPNA